MTAPFRRGDRVEWDLFCGTVETGVITRDLERPDRVPAVWVAHVLPDAGPPARPFAASALRPQRRKRLTRTAPPAVITGRGARRGD